jgi:hypothetical protein
LKGDVPPELERVVLRCLEKQREARQATGAELLKDLQRVRALFERQQARRALIWRRPAVAIPAALILVAGLSGRRLVRREGLARPLGSVGRDARRSRGWASKGKWSPAYRLALRAREILPGDRELERLWTA